MKSRFKLFESIFCFKLCHVHGEYASAQIACWSRFIIFIFILMEFAVKQLVCSFHIESRKSSLLRSRLILLVLHLLHLLQLLWLNNWLLPICIEQLNS